VSDPDAHLCICPRYKIERIKINRLLKAAAIAADPGEIDSPDPISSSDVPFQQGSAHAATENSDEHDGSDAVTSPKSDSGYVPGSVDRADGPAVAGPLRGDDDSEEDDHRDVSSASPDEYADETIRIDDMAAARRKYGSDDATADDAVESPEFSDTVCIDDMASARAAYGGAKAASAAGGDKDATSPEFSDTVQVHDMAAARVMYGGAASGAVTGVGGNEPPREMLLAECWNPDTGQIERRPSPDNVRHLCCSLSPALCSHFFCSVRCQDCSHEPPSPLCSICRTTAVDTTESTADCVGEAHQPSSN
jgi:hypothetical protein